MSQFQLEINRAFDHGLLEKNIDYKKSDEYSGWGSYFVARLWNDKEVEHIRVPTEDDVK